MVRVVEYIQCNGKQTVASCCGHGKYPITVVIKYKNAIETVYYELFSGIFIQRVKKFYKRDKQGYYYIPEVSKEC